MITAKGDGPFMLLNAHVQAVAKRLPEKDAAEFRKHIDEEIVTRLGLLEAAQADTLNGYKGPLPKKLRELLTKEHLQFKEHLATVEQKRVGKILELETKRRESLVKKPETRDPVLSALRRDRLERRALRLAGLSHIERAQRLRTGGQLAQDDLEALAIAAEDGITICTGEAQQELEREIEAAKTKLADLGDPELAAYAALRGDYQYTINVARNHATELATSAGIDTWSLSDTRMLSTGQPPQLTGENK